MESLKSDIRACTKCPELVSSRSQSVPGDGMVPAPIMFVGLAPGRNGADITGIPFTKDPSGLLFRDMLEQTGIKNVFVTNIVKCNPKDSKGNNRTPSGIEIKTCGVYLEDEIAKVSPKVIVPLGKQATEFFLGKVNKMKDFAMKQFSRKGRIIMPMLHPSYVIRGAYSRAQYTNDFNSLKEYHSENGTI